MLHMEGPGSHGLRTMNLAQSQLYQCENGHESIRTAVELSRVRVCDSVETADSK